jgi:hypothetical protein
MAAYPPTPSRAAFASDQCAAISLQGGCFSPLRAYRDWSTVRLRLCHLAPYEPTRSPALEQVEGSFLAHAPLRPVEAEDA